MVTNKSNKNKNKSIDLLGLNETHFKNKHFTINKFKLLKWISVNHATIKKNLLKKLTYNFFLNPYNNFLKKNENI